MIPRSRITPMRPGARALPALMLLTLSLATAAGEAAFTGTWSRSLQLCDRDHECTRRELKAPDTPFETCGSSLTLIQAASRLCGTWDSGCSFGQGSSGVLHGTASGRSAQIEVGESTAFRADRRYPGLEFSPQHLELRRGRLHVFVVDEKGVRHLDQVLERVPGAPPTLEHDLDFLAQCQAGASFSPE